MGRPKFNSHVGKAKYETVEEKHVVAPKPVNRATRRAAKAINSKRKK